MAQEPHGQFEAPNYFQVPVAWHERLAEIETIAELKVTLAVFRRTFGWHKRGDDISLTQIQEDTGLGRSTVVRGIEAGLKRGSFTKKKTGSSTRYLVELWFNGASPMLGPAGSPTVGPAASPTVGPTKDSGERKNTSSGQGPADDSLEGKRAKCWEHYLALADRHEVTLRSRDLTPSRARLLDKGLKEASLDECIAAITGLFASEWYRERHYSDLAYIFNTRPGGKTLREQIDRFIDYAEAAGQGLAVTSADPDTINRAKRAVLAGYDLAGNADSRATAERAEAWLASVGIEVDRSGERPTFKRKGSA